MKWEPVSSKAFASPSAIPSKLSIYVDDPSFTVRAEENNVDNLVGILHKFGSAFGLEISWA